ncbi:MAG TPA: hypothetical protein VMV29_22630 [Ktedonobacterales bacterium]|nr:hypothetical protein [Ktedonobacterales bacterium]
MGARLARPLAHRQGERGGLIEVAEMPGVGDHLKAPMLRGGELARLATAVEPVALAIEDEDRAGVGAQQWAKTLPGEFPIGGWQRLEAEPGGDLGVRDLWRVGATEQRALHRRYPRRAIDA